MEEIIKQKLATIEEENGFEILLACETGSRAWGFPSPDSDYDVRIIYKHELDWYLTLHEKDDTYNPEIVDELDITGWEFRKCLQLLWKSNAPLLERLQSPIVYQSNAQVMTQFRSLAEACFSPIATMHHYLSMSLKYLDICLEGDSVRLKSYFYAIRTAIAGLWIRETGSMPHIEMARMFGPVEQGVRDRIIELIDLKAGKNEDYVHPRENLIDEFLRETIEQNRAVAQNLPGGKGDSSAMDEFYRHVIKNG